MKSIPSILNVSLGLSLIMFTGGWSSDSWAWGERGHNTVGYTAARLIDKLSTKDEHKKLGPYFGARTLMLGHLSNIPDVSWKDRRRPSVVELNNPTHYFDAEYIVGPPTPKMSDYLDKIRNIDPNLETFLSTYDQKPNLLNHSFSINIAKDVGSAPFRIAQLHKMMTAAFKCASQKVENKGPGTDRPFREPIRNAKYECSSETTRLEDLAAAIEIGGVMGHFVGDLAQPYHTTVDHDGYARGQGGIHGYFETFLLQYIDDRLLADVRARASDPQFAKQVFNKQLKVDVKSDAPIAKIMFHLAADSYGLIEQLATIDKNKIVLSAGDKIAFGEKSNHGFKGAEAKRLPFDDPKAAKVLRPLIVDRLATAALILSELWLRAWREGGSPDVRDVNTIVVPYPVDVPFILPPKALIGDAYDKFKN